MSTNKTRTALSRRLVLCFSFMSVRFYCVLVYVECFFCLLVLSFLLLFALFFCPSTIMWKQLFQVQ